MRLIDADELIKFGWEMHRPVVNVLGVKSYEIASLEQAKEIDAEPVRHGRWLKHGYSCPCSICGFDFGWANTPMELMIPLMNYCPNCGAKMDGKEQSNETVSL